MEEQPKKKIDRLMYIAIIIMLVGVGLTINETRYCKDPFKYAINNQLKADYGDKVNYSYAKLEIYSNSEDSVPLTSYDIVGSKTIATWYRTNNFSSNFSNYIIKK